MEETSSSHSDWKETDSW